MQFLELGLLHPAHLPEPTTPDDSPDTLIAWLHLTDRCNLRCVYCYLPHNPEDMAPETGRKAVETIFQTARLHNLKKVQIKYAGGEPVLRIDLVFQLHELVTCLAHQYGIATEEVILSNATILTGPHLKLLKRLNFRLMVSLDGIDPAHDQQRVNESGQPVSKKVMQTIDAACGLGLHPSISITVTQKNAAYLAETVAWVCARPASFNLNFYRDNVFAAGRKELDLIDQDILAGIRSAFAWLAANPPRDFPLTAILDRSNLSIPHTLACGMGINYLVVRPDGGISSCHMRLGEALSNIHEVDPLRKIQSNRSKIGSVLVDEKTGCSKCEWRYACAGGCPLVAFNTVGRYDVPSPYCSIYKALYPELLRLEARRLLAVQI